MAKRSTADRSFARRCLGFLFEVFMSSEFEDAINVRTDKKNDILRWISEANCAPAKELRQELLRKYESRDDGTEFRSIFNEEKSPVLLELGTDQMSQIFKAALSFAMYGGKDGRVSEMFERYVKSGFLGSSLFLGSNYLGYNACGRGKGNDERATFVTKAPKPFEVCLFLHCLNSFQHLFLKKGKKGKQSKAFLKVHYHTSNRMGFAVQTVFKSWTTLAKSMGYENCEQLISPYILFNTNRGTFDVLGTKRDGFAPTLQSKTLFGGHKGTFDPEKVDKVAYSRSDEEDMSLRKLTGLMFHHMNEVASHKYLYTCETEESEWEFLGKYFLLDNGLPLVFKDMPPDVKKTIGRSVTEKGEEQEVIDVDATETVTENFVGGSAFKGTGRSLSGRKRKRFTPPPSAQLIKVEDELVETTLPPPKTARTEYGSTVQEKVIEEDSGFQQQYDQLLEGMSGICRVHDVSFEEVVETDAEDVGYYLDRKVDFIVTDPPYNTRSQRGAANSSHDLLTVSDMKNCVAVFDRVMKKGAHGLVFCSSLQFKTWFDLLNEYKRSETESESESESEKSGGAGRNDLREVFHAEEILMNFTNAPGHYGQNPGKRGRGHFSVVQTAIHFWKKGMSMKGAGDRAEYKSEGHIPSRHAVWTNCIDNIPRIEVSERVYFKGDGVGNKKMVRPEQKSVRLLKEIISQYTEPGDLVVDLFGGTFSTAKACLSLPGHRKFVGCDSDSKCVEASLVEVVHTYARQLVDADSDITGSENLVKVAQAFLSHQRISAKSEALNGSIWKPPPGLPIYQRLPVHVHMYLSNLVRDSRLVLLYRNTPPDLWPKEFRALLNTVDVNVLACIEGSARGLIMSASLIRHKYAGIGVFAAKQFKKKEPIVPYYGTLVYRDMGQDRIVTKEYGSGVLAVRKKRFLKCAVELNCEVEDDEQKKHKVHIVPAPFCIGSYINDPRYLPGDEEWQKRDTERGRKANVAFVEMVAEPTKRNLRSNKVLVIEAIRDIHVGEELYIGYGGDYVGWASAIGND